MPLIPAMLAPYRKLRHERPGEQPAQRSAAAGQEPGGGHGGRHPQHHPWDRHWQLGKRPLAHPGAGHREAGRHQQDQVKQYCLFVTLIMWSWRNATLFTLSHKVCVIKLWNKHSLEYVLNPGQNSKGRTLQLQMLFVAPAPRAQLSEGCWCFTAVVGGDSHRHQIKNQQGSQTRHI